MMDFKKLFIFTSTTLTIILVIMLYIHNLHIEKLSQKILNLKYNSFTVFTSINYNQYLRSVYLRDSFIKRFIKEYSNDTSMDRNRNHYDVNNFEGNDSIIDNQSRIDELERRVEDAEYRAEEAELKANQAQDRLEDMELDKLLGRDNSYIRY